MSIEVSGISKLYGEQRALDQVSLKLGKGEITGLLGPNGAGKSTLMKIITCFIPSNEGEVRVCGFSAADDPDEVRLRVGYLPEHNPLYPDMYVHEFLLFVAGLHKLPGDRKKRVAEMIELTGLTPEQHKKIGMLSKGFRQRVGLAQAMIHDPEVLILDEPTSGLDPNQLVEIRNLIKTLGKEKTVLFSTHIMQEVEALCSRVIIIDKGKIVADRPIGELSAITSGTELLLVEFDKPASEKQLRALPGVKGVQHIKGNTWHLETNPDVDVRSAVFQMAVSAQMKVLTITRTERKLEEVFQLLTKR
ncbi:MAG TPA: gliding motility-associated ABC transporter ATP-binding subunit GldA [Bacteroidales bacterium]|nr:gliding motility-associated ABC transporter ATP-binding subunit GldA [Bacteroidales bacterium]HRZ47860.1 gliding motility-associated ABC transporter ATP-binding subunit GldA [Bacteroidales bacterium]